MTEVPQDIANEFPEFEDRLQDLSSKNVHFGRLCDRYVNIDRTLQRTRLFIEPTDDFHTGELRKQRIMLRNQIRAMIRGGALAEPA